jgi:iron complex transport system ATP-binding protein
VEEPSAENSFVELRNVDVARGEQVVLRQLNLSIATGEHVAILGPNGCGKSTLIKTLTCECYPIDVPGMRVRIFGRERWMLEELRRHLGVVSAELPGRATAKTTGLDAAISGFFSSSTLWPNLVVTDAMRTAATDALRLMEAMHLADKRVGEMSAGESRRVMIARALVHKPQVLLLDEPTNALDLAAQRDLRLVLRRVAQAGTGILMVTHHLADILPEIERVIMMRHGRIVADGSRTELLTRERLSELFGVPVELAERDGFLHSWS